MAEGAVILALGATMADARAALTAERARPLSERLAASEAAANDALGGLAMPDPALGERVGRVARRALVNVYVARDRATGMIVASVDRQPAYFLDWPRDGAFFTVLLDVAGRSDHATQRALWYTDRQRALASAAGGHRRVPPPAPLAKLCPRATVRGRIQGGDAARRSL